VSSKYGRRNRCGPEYRPVCREEKIKEWAEAIKSTVRSRAGTALTDDEAASYADWYWRFLAASQMPVKEVMETPGTAAVKWLLITADGVLLDTSLVTDQNPEGEL
jgi:hypothetical protein